MRADRKVSTFDPMSDDDSRSKVSEDQMPEGEQSTDQARPERGASQDLADGLELMLRAARKAVRHVEPGRLEELGRRALGSLENLDKRKVGELGRKAARNLDPRRIEEIAEEAGRELLGVVERVADRVDAVLSGSRPGAGGPSEPPQPTAGEPAAPSGGPSDDDSSAGASSPKIRVEDE